MDADLNHSHRSALSLAVIGSGGAGVMTAGQLLLDAAAAAGLYGLMTRSTGPQIRGGEAAAIVRLSQRPVSCQDDGIELLVALDFEQAERFADELKLDRHSRVIVDPSQGDVPEWIAASGAALIAAPLAERAKSRPGARVNTVAAGLVGALTGLPPAAMEQALAELFSGKSQAIRGGALCGLALGRELAGELAMDWPPLAVGKTGPRWRLTGNEAVGYGALAGGVRFCAAYPITPSTEIQEWLAGALPRVGGALVQAEDELASINLCIGASFGGVPAMTATSGPGLSLMVEALGLATAAEIPLLVANVMRGGPSTGIPTKSEQSDLNLALHGAHGDAPRLVLAPSSLADCAPTAHWAISLAEALQSPALLLSDQFLGQARGVIDTPELPATTTDRRHANASADGYQRFAKTADGISPMGIPGHPGSHYTATGLSHGASARPSTAARDHLAQLDKRRHKLDAFDYGPRWADIHGDSALAVISFGSTAAVCAEAVGRLESEGLAVRLIALRLLAPLNRAGLDAALAGAERALVIELNHGAQLYHYLRARIARPAVLESLARPGPLTFRPGEIVRALRNLARRETA